MIEKAAGVEKNKMERENRNILKQQTISRTLGHSI
jgi:hypothetical protein